jgi:hypothetical protein
MARKPVYTGQSPKGVPATFAGPKPPRHIRVKPMLQKNGGR